METWSPTSVVVWFSEEHSCLTLNRTVMGVTKPISSVSLFAQVFQKHQTTCFPLNITVMFVRCCHSSVVATPVKYECDLTNLTMYSIKLYYHFRGPGDAIENDERFLYQKLTSLRTLISKSIPLCPRFQCNEMNASKTRKPDCLRAVFCGLVHAVLLAWKSIYMVTSYGGKSFLIICPLWGEYPNLYAQKGSVWFFVAS